MDYGYKGLKSRLSGKETNRPFKVFLKQEARENGPAGDNPFLQYLRISQEAKQLKLWQK